ncbi:type II secretion system secretin GspD [Pararhizobium qamdonense]|uniref:type II secretion system secretin GspD n=1 Tax=Pararhizobium qamdonense TaxID=3031126 RepID=UPI0023E1651D|nr:type II secretion system secretin GspD [Pararhizobium qamdonense]
MLTIRVGFSMVLAVLSGCASENSDDKWASLMEGVERPRVHDARGYPNSNVIKGSTVTGSTPAGFAQIGSGEFTGQSMSSVTGGAAADGSEGYTINLVDAPVALAAKKILGDIMGYTYLVDPKITGTVTLQTSHAMSKQSLLDILEVSLAANGAAIVKKADRYEIVPYSEATASNAIISGGRLPKNEPGMKVQVLQLKYIAADEMRDIIEEVSKKGAVLRTDPARNYIVVAGNNGELSAIREAISVFDVDWMKGMSTALYPLKASQPQELVKELNSVFGADAGPNSKTIRFIPNTRLNAVLAITSRPAYLPKVSAWIAKLDKIAQTNEEQLFVYEIQNRPAAELANVLQNVLASAKSNGGTMARPSPVAPDLVADTMQSEGVDYSPEAQVESEPALSTSGTVPSVVADTENNALLISTNAREYQRIEQILRQLDVLPTQVFLEAVIAEVTLNDELKFGLRWYLENGNNSLGLSDLASGAVTAAFPGFNWTHVSANAQSALSALSSVTKVKVISSPNLMVINNQQAKLQVGDQVPVITQTSTGTESANAVIINSVEMKDTGIILSVTPRINSSGRVMLDIQQEVSNVVATTTSGIDSPTIQQRKIATRVVVHDGESLALGGLIQEKKSLNQRKVPVLGDIPLLGNAFKSKTDGINRTELIIFIRPRIVRDSEEARQATDEFRQQFDFGDSDTPGKRMKRDLIRLAN